METTLLDPKIPTFERDCPIRIVIDRIADKWTILTMSLLSDGAPHRFNELRRNIEGISQKMLTQTLRDLERDGVVVRTLYPEIPPRVEYALTPMGVTLCEPIARLGQWASDHVDAIKRAQAEFDARRKAQALASATRLGL
ncbi:MAG: helix-turn-helix transcriptional regulator [Candidatus Eremiobacteraeota bacterium]|nr:helix-turn-helix transcriptional regulator [Candidatus Eremiobacteraeota bacterium]MBV8372155.1 helix-turn-helix transcriptional regulator [Candidatus Eremiobacteraeota bacterium]